MANTAGTLSEALIASMAAGLLDDYHVTSLDDDTTLGRYLSREFGQVRREVLEEYPWYKARTLANLIESGSAPPFGFAAKYQLPADCVRVWRVTCTDRFDGPPTPFKVYGTELHCNVKQSLNVIYIKDLNNVGLWSAGMGRVFAAKMAMYASQNVTGKAGYFDKTRSAYQDASISARMVDALSEGSGETLYDTGDDGFDVMNSRGLYR